jgi:hypothetical protein
MMDVEAPVAGGNEAETHEELVAEEQGTTAECPPPPTYFKAFVDADAVEEIAPPSFDAVTVAEGETLASTLQKGVYGGLVGSLQKQYVYDPETEYRDALKGRVDDVLQTFIELISNVPPNKPIEESTTAIQGSLERLHELLGEYRHHEARSNLIKLRDVQIQDLSALNTAITEALG